jgi:hypothetical protein
VGTLQVVKSHDPSLSQMMFVYGSHVSHPPTVVYFCLSLQVGNSQSNPLQSGF